MSRPRKAGRDWLPKYCYPNRGRIVYRPPGEKDVRLCSLAEATRELVVRRLAEHLEARPDTSTLRWLCQQYHDSAKFARLADSTRKAYETHRRTLLACRGKNGVVMGDVTYKALTTGVLQRYVDRRAAEGDPVAGNREIKGYLSAVFTWAQQRDLVAGNPCREVEKNPETARVRYVEDWELEFFERHATPAYLPIVAELAYLLAARITEVLRLTRADLLDDGVRVRRLKGSKTNVVKWSPRLRAAVDAAQALPARAATTLLLHDGDGQALKYAAVRSAWELTQRRCSRKADSERLVWLSFTRHDLKRKGVTDHESGKIGGHKTEAMRQRYRVNEEREEPVR